MTDADLIAEPGPDTSSASISYRMSWLDYLLRRIDQLPGSGWWIHLILGLLLLLLLSIGLWLEGVVPLGKFLLTHIFLSGTISFFLATTASLNKRALSALDEMRPVLTLEEKQLHLMRQKLTKMPAFPALLSSLFLLGFVFITEAIGGKP